MNAFIYNLTAEDTDTHPPCAIEQGATYGQTFVWKHDGSAVNLSTYTARMHVRKTPSSSGIVLALTTENGRITLGSSGQVTLGISAVDTAALPVGHYVYDLELVHNDTVVRLLQGAVDVTRNVTR